MRVNVIFAVILVPVHVKEMEGPSHKPLPFRADESYRRKFCMMITSFKQAFMWYLSSVAKISLSPKISELKKAYF